MAFWKRVLADWFHSCKGTICCWLSLLCSTTNAEGSRQWQSWSICCRNSSMLWHTVIFQRAREEPSAWSTAFRDPLNCHGFFWECCQLKLKTMSRKTTMWRLINSSLCWTSSDRTSQMQIDWVEEHYDSSQIHYTWTANWDTNILYAVAHLELCATFPNTELRPAW